MVFESIAGGLLKAALPKVAGAIAIAVKDKLHPTQLEKALEAGLRESGAFDRRQKVNNDVFYRCTDKEADTFLAMLLEHPEVQRELQKPLEQDGAPDVAMLVQVAKHIAVDRNLSVDDKTLEPWLKTFANAYFDAITAIRFQVAKANYLKQLANWFDDVKFAGVAVLGQDVERAERLAQIFVMPDVEEDGRRGRDDGLRGWGDEGIADDRQSQLLQEQRLRTQLERSGRKFSARQLLNQHQKKVVLLGAPGSGKTTLMSFFAVTLAERQGAIATTSGDSTDGLQPNTIALSGDTKGLSANTMALRPATEGLRPHTMALSGDTKGLFADTEGLRLDPLALQTDALPLPILIRIRDWARTPDVTIPEYARQFAENTMSCKPLPKGFFEHWLNNGRSLILLDGLDEVAEESKRYHLVQCIENFLGQYPQNRAIITSRPAGYKRDFFRTEEFPHYELQPFDDGKIEEFCDRWYTSRVPDQAEAQRRKESLQKALNQQDRIKLLARNPLLLTIIALIHRYQARLPRERYKLYDKAVETLLTAWDDNKELSNKTVLKYLQLDDLRRLMESLAYWIHTQGNTGDREGGTLIDKDELIQKLCQEIKTLKQLKQYEAKAEAERFVKFIRDRTGLLNEQGQDCYAFVHKTFQEYLAAQDINYQADNEDDFEIVLTHIEQHLHDPHWREVLLLLTAQQSPKKAARAIRKVLTANSPYEQWLHRDLLFAGRCLAEDPKNLKGADSQLSLEILGALVEIESNSQNKVSDKVRSQVFQVLCSFEETDFEAQILKFLNDRADQIDKVSLQKYLGALGQREKAIQTLIALLDDKDAKVRFKAAYAIQYLGKVSESSLQALLKLLDDEDDEVHWRIAFLLPDLGKITEEVVQANLALLKSDRGFGRYSSETLSRLVNASESMAHELLILLKDGQNAFIRGGALFGLGESNISESIIPNLAAALEDASFSVRAHTARTLFKLGDTSMIQELVSWLQKSDSSIDRHIIARTLVELGESPEIVIKELLVSLDDKPYGCLEAADMLVSLNKASELIMEELVPLLEGTEHFVQNRTAEILGKLGKKADWVMPLLVQWIEQHQGEECVGAGIDALWEIVEGEG